MMAKAISLAGYMGPKRDGEKYAARYSATLRDGRVWFSGGESEHSVSAAIPLKDINAHWAGYCGQGRYKAAPRGITKAIFLAAHKQIAWANQ